MRSSSDAPQNPPAEAQDGERQHIDSNMAKKIVCSLVVQATFFSFVKSGV
ncbi:major facilitator superfamily transporter [Colletotrichum orchidophilum]|uniref:Major facilitator superfamily transporter n=1 Tax=Colletotrichum orchidophilum TaxID=1209926 RepID=A0A1G4AUA7_9PEZI|nr:major facilitator superfamily transporter [Colletotrichum orchidophilum]OHE92759.1 major facilitator superfamily transporter [Colletotrichum orchidophilum]